MNVRRGILPAFAVLALAAPAEAQLTVQIPVMHVFSVQTTVSVPDRGEILLGGVSRARSARSSYRPFGWGSSVGTDRENSAMSAKVWIHDFEAMDRALLAGGEGGSRTRLLDSHLRLHSRLNAQPGPPLRSPVAAHAWRTLSSGRARLRTANPATTARLKPSTRPRRRQSLVTSRVRRPRRFN